MIAKGLDLPLVTLVGAVLADVGLNFPDFRTGERAFQLLTQVAGRAGRSQLGGKAILQTFQPDHYAIKSAAKHDFTGFYSEEIVRRRKIQYPPFSRIIRFEIRDHDPSTAEEKAARLASDISNLTSQSNDKTLRLIGPAPPYFHKKSGYYRWQVILKGNRPEEIARKLKLDDWRVDVDPPNLL
jgi:primosomal protein N' (replication factor Y)